MPDPVPPEPDGKDWTWAIGQACAECGFDGPGVHRAEVPDLTRRFAAVLVERLEAPGAATRTQPTTWSPLEYGCHVRDVCRLFAQRLDRMRAEDDPQFANWDQDETAITERYWDQDPETVAGELRDAAATIADAFGSVRDDEWARPGTRSNGSVFAVDTFARYFLHDLAHHAWDVPGKRW